MFDALTLEALLSAGTDTAAVIGAPARVPLTHGELLSLIARTFTSLNAPGAGRSDRDADADHRRLLCLHFAADEYLGRAEPGCLIG